MVATTPLKRTISCCTSPQILACSVRLAATRSALMSTRESSASISLRKASRFFLTSVAICSTTCLMVSRIFSLCEGGSIVSVTVIFALLGIVPSFDKIECHPGTFDECFAINSEHYCDTRSTVEAIGHSRHNPHIGRVDFFIVVFIHVTLSGQTTP